MKGGHFSSSDKITLLPFGHHQHHHHRHHAEDPLAAGPDLEEQRHGPEEEEEEEEEDARSIASLVHVRSQSKDFRKLWVISLLLTMCLTLLVVFSLLWLGGMFNESMGRKGFIDNTSRWSGPEQRGETKEKIGENIEEQDEEESDKQSRREKDYDHESTTTTTASLSGLYELSHFSPDFDDYLRSLSIPEFLFPFIKNTTEHVEVQEPTEGSRVWHIRHTSFFDHILNFELDQPFYMPVSGEDTRFLHYLCRRPCPKKLTCAITDEIKGSYLLSEMTFTEEGITFARTNLNGFHVGHSHYIRVMTPKEYEEAFQEEEEGEAMMGGGNNIPAEWNEEMEMEVWD